MNAHHPSLGELYDPFGRDLENPFPMYARLRREDPISFSPVLNAYLVSRLEDVRAILSQPELFSSKDTLAPITALTPEALAELSKGAPVTPSFINSDGANHKRFSQPLQKAFTPARMRTLEPMIREKIAQLLAGFIDAKQVEIISQFAYPLPLEVIFTVLGIPQEDREKIKPLCDAWTALLLSPLPEDQQVAYARDAVALHAYLIQLIEKRRRTPQEDLISELITTTLPEEEPLSEAELIWTIVELIVAVHETTTNLIGNGLVLLLQQPERWHLLCEHPEYLPLTIEEILRYSGPVLGSMRTTTQPITRQGIAMPAGTKLFLLYSSANRDELHFAFSDHFQLRRSPNHHMAFGHGTHASVSAPLVRLQGRLAFEALIQQLPGLRLTPGQHFTHTSGLLNIGYEQINVEW